MTYIGNSKTISTKILSKQRIEPGISGILLQCLPDLTLFERLRLLKVLLSHTLSNFN